MKSSVVVCVRCDGLWQWYLEAVGEELQLRVEVTVGVEVLEGLETLQSDLSLLSTQQVNPLGAIR